MQLYAVCINGKKILSAVQASEKVSFYAAILFHTSPQRIKRTEQIIFIGFGNLRDNSYFFNSLSADIADISAERIPPEYKAPRILTFPRCCINISDCRAS